MIYGDSGLGKTHLAQAIGIQVKEQFPDKVVLYVNANKFQTQFVESIRNNNRNLPEKRRPRIHFSISSTTFIRVENN